ncbi:ankyrin repeat protein, partial [Aaosphaeria arxii CBS 175.79]
GQSATWLAAFTGKLELVTKLLELNPNLDKGDYDGWTPLHVGVDNLEITKLLIGSGANPNRGKQDNYTPLHLATAWKEEQIVTFLLEHGADPRITTDDGRTALHL